MSTLRRWQSEALDAHDASTRPDFLAVATPGAGKTRFALAVAAKLRREGKISQLVVVAPSEHLKTQWADAAEAAGFPIDPSFSNSDGVTSGEFCGIATTYAQVAAAPDLHHAGVAGAPTLVILDEVHHAGDGKSWGDAVAHAYSPAVSRLALSGTPWRSDAAPIPFVDYVETTPGVRESQASYTYTYADALADKVVRPVLFYVYSGAAEWTDAHGALSSGSLSEPMTKSALRTVWRQLLSPDGTWVREVLTAANDRLSTVRESVPDAGGLVIASDTKSARAYADILTQVSGTKATVVTSDTPGSSAAIDSFASSRDRWLVAVRMVSEGVDIPRLSVGVFATNTSTALFFNQAVGRFVRARRPGEVATVFLPAVPDLLAHAATLEDARNHVIATADAGEDMLAEFDELEQMVRDEPGMDLSSTVGTTGAFDHLLLGSQAVSGTDAGHLLTLPGLLNDDDVAAILRPVAVAGTASSPAVAAAAVPHHRKVLATRQALHRAVSRISARTGISHGEVHSVLRAKTRGPVVAAANLADLHERLTLAENWPARR